MSVMKQKFVNWWHKIVMKFWVHISLTLALLWIYFIVYTEWDLVGASAAAAQWEWKHCYYHSVYCILPCSICCTISVMFP